MREIKTKFGTIYIEELSHDHHYADREDESKIKLFDSEERYLDYFEVETLENNAEFSGRSVEEEVDAYVKRLESIETIEELVNEFAYNGYEIITKDWQKAANCLNVLWGNDVFTTPERLLENEWVNKIGDYYIVVSE